MASVTAKLSGSVGHSTYVRLSPIQLGLIGTVIAALTVASTEPALTFACLVTLVLGVTLLWRLGEPPILFLAFAIQWLQVSLPVFRASLLGVSLSELLLTNGMILATWLSLTGLLVLAVAIRWTLRGMPKPAFGVLYAEVQHYDLKRAFLLYCWAQVIVLLFDMVSGWYPGLRQVLLALGNLRWAFVFILAVIILVQRRGYGLLVFVLVFEVVRGFLSYYSDFKEVFVVLILAMLAARPKIHFKTVVGGLVLLMIALPLAASWSLVKTSYRRYLDNNNASQTEQLSLVTTLMLDGLSRLPEGFDRLAQRVEYTYFFGRAVQWVPDVMPHANGEIWTKAIVHVLTPRLLYPDKPNLTADLMNTEIYTGLNILEQAGYRTEVPLGYMAESYIDFGPLGMFVPIFLLGLLYGAQYRYFISRPRYILFAYAVIPVVLRGAAQFETSAVKIFGGNLTTFITAYIALLWLAPRLHAILQGAPTFGPISPARGLNAPHAVLPHMPGAKIRDVRSPPRT